MSSSPHQPMTESSVRLLFRSLVEEGRGEQGAVGREKMMGELVFVWCHKLGKAECSGRKGIGMWKIRLEGIREG